MCSQKFYLHVWFIACLSTLVCVCGRVHVQFLASPERVCQRLRDWFSVPHVDCIWAYDVLKVILFVLVKSEATPYWQCHIQMYFGTVWMAWVPKKMCSKKVLVILLPYIFHVKPKYSLQILKNKVISRESNILPQMHWTSDIFGHSATIIGSFQVSLNYPFLNFKKMVCPKSVWMQHWLGA